MNSRDILAANFKKLRAAAPSLSRLPDITKAGGGSNGTLGRIAGKETGATVDTVEQLAAVYDLQAWQLLVPTLEAHTGPNGKPVVTGLPDWPFALVDRARYEALTPEQRGHVQANFMNLIREAEGLAPPKKRTGPERGRSTAAGA